MIRGRRDWMIILVTALSIGACGAAECPSEPSEELVIAVVENDGVDAGNTQEEQKRVSLGPFWKFARDYQPQSPDGKTVPTLPRPPQEVVEVIENHDIDDDYIQCMALILVRLQRFYLEEYHQEYDLRIKKKGRPGYEDNPILEAFARISGIRSKNRRASLPVWSGVVEDWVRLLNHILENRTIKEEWKRIQAALEIMAKERFEFENSKETRVFHIGWENASNFRDRPFFEDRKLDHEEDRFQVRGKNVDDYSQIMNGKIDVSVSDSIPGNTIISIADTVAFKLFKDRTMYRVGNYTKTRFGYYISVDWGVREESYTGHIVEMMINLDKEFIWWYRCG